MLEDLKYHKRHRLLILLVLYLSRFTLLKRNWRQGVDNEIIFSSAVDYGTPSFYLAEFLLTKMQIITQVAILTFRVYTYIWLLVYTQVCKPPQKNNRKKKKLEFNHTHKLLSLWIYNYQYDLLYKTKYIKNHTYTARNSSKIDGYYRRLLSVGNTDEFSVDKIK